MGKAGSLQADVAGEDEDETNQAVNLAEAIVDGLQVWSQRRPPSRMTGPTARQPSVRSPRCSRTVMGRTSRPTWRLVVINLRRHRGV